MNLLKLEGGEGDCDRGKGSVPREGMCKVWDAEELVQRDITQHSILTFGACKYPRVSLKKRHN